MIYIIFLCCSRSPTITIIVMACFAIASSITYAHDYPDARPLVRHYDDHHGCHFHVYGDGTKRDWNVNDFTRLSENVNPPWLDVHLEEGHSHRDHDGNGFPHAHGGTHTHNNYGSHAHPVWAHTHAGESVPDPETAKTHHHFAKRQVFLRLAVVITEVHVLKGKIGRVKLCSNVPHYNFKGKLLQQFQRHSVEIPLENSTFEPPVWNREQKVWDEICKVVALDIEMTPLLLMADGSNADRLGVDLADGIWYRQYQRINQVTSYPYFAVVNGGTQAAWYQSTLTAPSIPYRRKLAITWGALKL